MNSRWMHYRLGACLLEESPAPAPEVRATPGGLPERVDLRAHCSPVEDQGRVGSCAANAVVGAMEYHQSRKGESVTDLSRLYVYYNARALAGRENEDCGTFIHHVMAAVLAHGACPESMWPYIEAMWPMRPAEPCFQAAMGFEAVQYARTPLGPDCKSVLAAGLPVVFGASLPEAWMRSAGDHENRLRTPDGDWPAPGGGHAMLIVGYDDLMGSRIIRNTWGAYWGDGGYAYVDYEVIQSYSHPFAFWTIGAVESQPGLVLTGMPAQEARSNHAATAARDVGAALSALKQDVRSGLEQDLDAKRRGIRERLRGPGAGGGY